MYRKDGWFWFGLAGDARKMVIVINKIIVLSELCRLT